MHVVPGVAAIAGIGWFLSGELIGVTATAVHFPVGTMQLEFRIAIVIETHFLPIRFHMTVLALRAQTALVHVILLMAADAGCGKLACVQGRRVTCATFDRPMRVSQREVRVPLVVEVQACPL